MKCVNVMLVIIVILTFFTGIQTKCDKLFAKGVSNNEKNIIVNRHNEIRLAAARGQIPGQPKASNMKRMSWDNYLADAAQKIAETCIFQHVSVNDTRFPVGQNLYAASNTGNNNKTANWVSGINAWYSEYKTFIFGSHKLNHYTQEVWADTYLVGCGYTNFQKTPGWYDKIYVCNYGPAGNYVGENPYKTGAGCENLC